MRQIGKTFIRAMRYLLNNGNGVFGNEHKKRSKKKMKKHSKAHAMTKFSKDGMIDAPIDLFLERPVVSKEEESCDIEK